jgi:hypothetical protein
MQLNAQLWSDLLWLSGGLLELGKCSFHHIHFDFAPDGSSMMQSGTFGEPLQVCDEQTKRMVTIPAKLAYTAHKTLGHHKAPAGSNQNQQQILQTNSDIYAKLVSTSSCNRMDSWFFYRVVYLKSIGYVLPNCFFPKKVLTKIQQSALRAFLAKSGYNCNTHRAIIFVPIRFGGYGFFPLYLLQGEGQILTFLENWRTNTNSGKLLCIAVSWTQLHIGTSFSFFQDTSTPLPHMHGRWLPSLRTFLNTINGFLELDTFFLPSLQRTNDEYIMDLVLQSGAFKPDEIKQINHCHLYLQAITFANICLSDGKLLDSDMLNGTLGSDSSTSSWVHINQARPHELSWQLWR